jgi:hypothetical protein
MALSLFSTLKKTIMQAVDGRNVAIILKGRKAYECPMSSIIVICDLCGGIDECRLACTDVRIGGGGVLAACY